MKLYQRIITRGLVVSGLAGFLGCDNQSKQGVEIKEPTHPYFAELPMHSERGMAMVSGDFDGDGDLDLIAGARPLGGGVILYKFNNDGKDNLRGGEIYFSELPMHPESDMTMVSGDFDGDGDLDLIVGVRPFSDSARLYKFTNDGKGNFSQ